MYMHLLLSGLVQLSLSHPILLSGLTSCSCTLVSVSGPVICPVICPVPVLVAVHPVLSSCSLCAALCGSVYSIYILNTIGIR